MPVASVDRERAPRRLPLVGAQLSTAGGWGQVPDRAIAVGAEVVQVFSSNPRVWPTAPADAPALDHLRRSLLELGLPLFIHAIYLINPASPDDSLRERSVAALRHALVTAALAGAEGVVTHLGSHRGEGFDRAAPWIADALVDALAQAQHELAGLGTSGRPMPPLLMETAAGSGATVGGTLLELEVLLKVLGSGVDPAEEPRFGLCLDTAHMFAAGYPVHQPQGLSDLLLELEHRTLLERVGLMHLNDSMSLLGSKRDRHANPGEGELGREGLAALVRHPAFAQVPFVLEVPGSEERGPGRREIATVKRMRQGAPTPPASLGDSGRGPTRPR
jgi:deoxyribonuclease-4